MSGKNLEQLFVNIVVDNENMMLMIWVMKLMVNIVTVTILIMRVFMHAGMGLPVGLIMRSLVTEKTIMKLTMMGSRRRRRGGWR